MSPSHCRFGNFRTNLKSLLGSYAYLFRRKGVPNDPNHLVHLFDETSMHTKSTQLMMHVAEPKILNESFPHPPGVVIANKIKEV